jgi:excisionase family DNA binding protein
MNPPDGILTADQAAIALGVDRRYVLMLIKTGKLAETQLPGIGTTRRRLISQKSLESYARRYGKELR